MQGSRYDREQLLKEALLQEGVSMGRLEQALEMSEREIFSGFYEEDASEHTKRICQILLIDPGYFFGRLRYENGRLVST